MKGLIASAPIALILAASGCATKAFVRNETKIVNDRVTQVQTQTNEQIASLSAKHQADVSRLDERITTTDNKLTATTRTAEEAQGSAAQANTTASQAVQQLQAHSAQISATSSNIAKMQADLAAQARALDYKLVGTENIIFAFDKSELSDEAKAALDAMAGKANATPRTFLEVVGFTDTTGSESYNVGLSQKRAEAVGRYLVRQNIPLKNMSMIGLGEDQTPQQLSAEIKGFDPNVTPAQLRGLARRVRIRMWVPETTTTTASAGTGGNAAEADVAGNGR